MGTIKIMYQMKKFKLTLADQFIMKRIKKFIFLYA